MAYTRKVKRAEEEHRIFGAARSMNCPEALRNIADFMVKRARIWIHTENG
jgi:hypothetical protein